MEVDLEAAPGATQPMKVVSAPRVKRPPSCSREVRTDSKNGALRDPSAAAAAAGSSEAGGGMKALFSCAGAGAEEEAADDDVEVVESACKQRRSASRDVSGSGPRIVKLPVPFTSSSVPEPAHSTMQSSPGVLLVAAATLTAGTVPFVVLLLPLPFASASLAVAALGSLTSTTAAEDDAGSAGGLWLCERDPPSLGGDRDRSPPALDRSDLVLVEGGAAEGAEGEEEEDDGGGGGGGVRTKTMVCTSD